MIDNEELKKQISKTKNKTIKQLTTIKSDINNIKDSNSEIGSILQVIKDYQAIISTQQQQIAFYEKLVANLENKVR